MLDLPPVLLYSPIRGQRLRLTEIKTNCDGKKKRRALVFSLIVCIEPQECESNIWMQCT